jgi:hypothetical protein
MPRCCGHAANACAVRRCIAVRLQAPENTSETDRTSAVKDTAGGSKNRTIREATKAAFKAAKAAITRSTPEQRVQPLLE